MPSGYYQSQKNRLMIVFTLSRWIVKGLGIRCYGKTLTNRIMVQARREYESLLPRIPYIGGKQNPHTRILITAAMFLALYRAMQVEGKTVADAGDFIISAVIWFYDRLPLLLRRWMGEQSFSERTLQQIQEQAKVSRKREYPGDWVYIFVDGDGHQFDYGIDQLECGICKFYTAQNAEELTPYMCELDFVVSDRVGWGLQRKFTLAEGHDKCDFRFKQPTSELLAGKG